MDFPPPKRPLPRPGSLPLKRPASADAPPHPAQSALPPFLDAEPPERPTPKTSRRTLDKLKTARRQVEALGALVRDEAFDEWVSRCLVPATDPASWTQAADLYRNYISQAGSYGRNRGDRALAKLALATETRWGKMMTSVFPKQRRTRGWYYPVRLKRGSGG